MQCVEREFEFSAQMINFLFIACSILHLEFLKLASQTLLIKIRNCEYIEVKTMDQYVNNHMIV